MLTIQIPVADEVIIAKMYLNVDVQLTPIMPPRTVRAQNVLAQVQTKLSQEIYTAIKNVVERLEAK